MILIYNLPIEEPKIKRWGLQDKVKDWLETGLAVRTISEIINENYLPEGEEPISPMAIQRWKENNNIGVEKINPNIPIVDPLSELIVLKNKADKALSRAEGRLMKKTTTVCPHCLREFESQLSVNEFNQTMATYDRALQTKQRVLKGISDMQKDLFQFQNIKKAVKIIFHVLYEKYKEAYAAVVVELKNHKDLFNMLKI